MRKGMFDYNGDGKLDANERAAEMMFIDEVILNEENAQNSAPAGRRRGEPIGMTFAGMPLYDRRKDSNGVVILKSLAVIALCIGGIAVPCLLDMGDLGMGLCMLLGPALSMLILKNT